MALLAHLALWLLTQTPTTADVAAPAAPESTAPDRAAAAAERAAAAAEQTAVAAQRIANALAPAAPSAGPVAPPAASADGWKGSAGAGLAFITGNAQTITLTANVAADRKWDAWAFGVRANGAYGLANPTANVKGTTGTTTARRAMGTIRGDRTFGTSFASVFVLGGLEADHMKNIETRTVGEAGTGLTFFNKKDGDLEKLFLRVDLALRTGYETRVQYFPTMAPVDPYGVVILAPRGALAFRWAFSNDVRFSEEIEFMPYLLASSAGRLLINNTTKLSARITESVALTTSLLVNYDSEPPQSTPARVSTDVALTAGVEASF
jgi:putative salt-induced outer membrane protein YdiY